MSLSSPAGSPARTLVMGARRGIGRLVLDRLAESGVPLRASARSIDGWSVADGVERVRADLTDTASLAAAFDGVAQVFLLAVPESALQAAEAARAAGVAKVVLLSSGSLLVPTSGANPITVEHREVEEAFRAVGGPVLVPIRPLVLATNALGWAGEIRTSRSVRLYQPDASNAPVHEADVAAVAAAALSGPGGRDEPDRFGDLLTGPQQLTQREQVALVGRALDQDVAVLEQTRDEALAHFGRFVGAVQADAILQFLDDCAAGNSPATDTAEVVLGRPPLTFERWAADHVEDFS